MGSETDELVILPLLLVCANAMRLRFVPNEAHGSSRHPRLVLGGS